MATKQDQQFQQSVTKMEAMSHSIAAILNDKMTTGESVMVLTITLDSLLQTCDKSFLKEYAKVKNTMREAGILKSV